MIQNNVYLRKEDHRYFDHDGNEYSSVSKVLNSIEEGFDAEAISKNVAGKGKYEGMTAEQIKQQWKGIGQQSADHGSEIHDCLDYYSKTAEIQEKHLKYTALIKSVFADYIGYKRTFDEVVLYHKSFGIAGTADKILQVNSRKNIVDIEDYKTNNRKGIVFFNEYNKFKKFPVEHLTDCNYIRYALQMSIYGVMYEHLTQGQVRGLWIRFIPPDNTLEHRRIPVPYMKTDAIKIMSNFSDLKKTQPATNILSL